MLAGNLLLVMILQWKLVLVVAVVVAPDVALDGGGGVDLDLVVDLVVDFVVVV